MHIKIIHDILCIKQNILRIIFNIAWRITYMFNKIKDAFTLAEVLITLMILGVISILTIPALVRKIEDMQTVTQVKSAYSIFANAYLRAIAENGTGDNWDIGTTNSSQGAIRFYNYLKPYLNIKKTCGNNAGCFAKNYKSLNGNAAWTDIDTQSVFAKGQLQNGMSFLFWINKRDINVNFGGMALATVLVDVNGLTAPNRLGYDTFEFTFYPARLSYSYVTSGSNSCNITIPSSTGLTCSVWILKHGNMDYKYRDVSAEW